ncbi:MAG: FAD-dependent oxidoreductase [Planctomycetota bacterium]|nr:FAD-dependent oxidoreductase [Planctomycetota bacterium]
MEATSADHVAVTVDGRTSQVRAGTTILDAARQMGIAIPTLCHYRGLNPYGACRVCVVEVETPRGPRQVASCSYPLDAPTVVHTDTDAVRQSRQTVLELLLAQAPDSTELQTLAAEMGVKATAFEKAPKGKCVLCGLCVRVCNELMGRGAINMFGRGAPRKVQTAFGEPSDQCQACGACAVVCPTGAIDLAAITARHIQPHITRYDQYLTARPSIDMAHPQAAPRVPSIDRENCLHFRTGECGLCKEVCQAGAIDYDQQETTRDLTVGAVVLTPGFEAFDATRRGEFGYGFARNVVTNVQFERLLSASGPTAGHVQRPSDGKAPRKLAFIQCVGSRDTGCDNEYCSSVCCMAATKEAIQAKEHEPDLDVTIFFLDLRAFGKDFDRYCERAKNQLGVRYVRSFISRTYEMPETKNLALTYLDANMKRTTEEFDMVVLSLGLEPSATLQQQAERLKVALNRWGFAQTTELDPLTTSRPGVFVGGTFQEPKDIPETVMQATAAAAKAMTLLARSRGSAVKVKKYPLERDVTDEPARIGVFICHCGSNIASVVDVAAVVKAASALPNVVLAEHNTYTCADDTQDRLKDKIDEYRLNRVVIASCTPRTHEPIFRDTLRDAGLNQYLVEMANIRDQCSWVHSGDPVKATAKAIDRVRMSVGRAARLVPLAEETIPVKNSALVIGGGVAGMTAALALADQGFPVELVEKSDVLGGTARQIHTTLDGADVQAYLARAIERVGKHPRIKLHLNSHVAKVEGGIGDFTSHLVTGEQTAEITHGVAVLATGALEAKPTTYGYGQSPSVLTQVELSERLAAGTLDIPAGATIAMIQCVEQRTAERPYCSRVCCTQAVKNALELRRKYPQARVVVLYRDMRTYGFREAAYRQAREAGVLFVRYEADAPPQVALNGQSIRVSITEPALGRAMDLQVDLLALAAPMVPRADRKELSDLLRVPLNADGFFLEAHVKLRPVDFASEGLFLAGTVHAPKFLTETISQANAVAARAAAILSRKRMPVSGQIAWVDPEKCISCMTCVHVCPYGAPKVGTDNKAEVQSAVCMGCGNCTAECPAKALSLRHCIDVQVLGAIGGLLTPDAAARGFEPVYPEQVGVARPKWHAAPAPETQHER